MHVYIYIFICTLFKIYCLICARKRSRWMIQWWMDFNRLTNTILEYVPAHKSSHPFHSLIGKSISFQISSTYHARTSILLLSVPLILSPDHIKYPREAVPRVNRTNTNTNQKCLGDGNEGKAGFWKPNVRTASSCLASIRPARKRFQIRHPPVKRQKDRENQPFADNFQKGKPWIPVAVCY